MYSIKTLQTQFPHPGKVEWLGLRPARDIPIVTPTQVVAVIGKGLQGDRFVGGSQGKRQVTLIQAEHLAAIAALLGRESVPPDLLRRNIVVSGINLLALKTTPFLVGEVLLEMTGLCHPCSKMETALGRGGYNAMRSHGGITTKVLHGGVISLGDPVLPAGFQTDSEPLPQY